MLSIAEVQRKGLADVHAIAIDMAKRDCHSAEFVAAYCAGLAQGGFEIALQMAGCSEALEGQRKVITETCRAAFANVVGTTLRPLHEFTIVWNEQPKP